MVLAPVMLSPAHSEEHCFHTVSVKWAQEGSSDDSCRNQPVIALPMRVISTIADAIIKGKSPLSILLHLDFSGCFEIRWIYPCKLSLVDIVNASWLFPSPCGCGAGVPYWSPNMNSWWKLLMHTQDVQGGWLAHPHFPSIRTHFHGSHPSKGPNLKHSKQITSSQIMKMIPTSIQRFLLRCVYSYVSLRKSAGHGTVEYYLNSIFAYFSTKLGKIQHEVHCGNKTPIRQTGCCMHSDFFFFKWRKV